jgi:hypothetical protein
MRASPGAILAVLSLAAFMAGLDLFIVNVAFDDIGRDFAGASLMLGRHHSLRRQQRQHRALLRVRPAHRHLRCAEDQNRASLSIGFFSDLP